MAKTSELLEKLSKELSDPDNEILKSADGDEQILNIVAGALISCAQTLSSASIEIIKFESKVDDNDLDDLVSVANELDGDEETSKYAGSVDNLLKILNKEAQHNKLLGINIDELENVNLDTLYALLTHFNNEKHKAAMEIHREKDLGLEKSSYGYLEVKINNINSMLNAINFFIKQKETESLDDVGKLASILDQSEDVSLAKVASVLDEILLTIAKPKNAIESIKLAEESEIEKLRIKYKTPSPDLFTIGNEKKEKLTEEYTKEIEDKIKKYKPNEAPLSARTCPDHQSIMLQRVGDHTVQCPLDRKIYNYDAGYTLMDGSVVPGSAVQGQTDFSNSSDSQHVSFSNRQDKLNENNG